MPPETIGTLKRLERILREVFERNPKAIQVDGAEVEKNSKAVWCYYKPSLIRYRIHGDTKRSAVELLSKLCQENEYLHEKVFVPDKNALRLRGTLDAEGWYCYEA